MQPGVVHRGSGQCRNEGALGLRHLLAQLPREQLLCVIFRTLAVAPKGHGTLSKRLVGAIYLQRDAAGNLDCGFADGPPPERLARLEHDPRAAQKVVALAQYCLPLPRREVGRDGREVLLG
eukprot:9466185-Pyramimonas_sp.AAC.1